MPVPSRRAAIRSYVHAVTPSGGTEVAAATYASRTPGVHLGPAAAGPVGQGRQAAAGEPAPQVRTVAAVHPRFGGDPRVHPARVGRPGDPGPPRQRLRRRRPPHDRLQPRLAPRP